METCKICQHECEQEKDICSNCRELIKKLDFKTFNEERKWIEELFVSRFNNFLLIFSLIVTAGFANNFNNWKSIVFYFGSLLLFFCWLPLIRAYHKYDHGVRILLTTKDFKDERNQIEIMQRLYERRKNNMFKTFTMSKWLAYYIPIACIVFLIAVGLGITFCVIK
ncbi:MAG TPA: hypothetical protein GXZ87_08395 [Bacteroidales bacterium]|nr:hypothetical protein [Bacteroidales bacterium]